MVLHEKREVPFVVLPSDPPVVVMLDGVDDSTGEFLACGHCMEPVLSPGDRLRIEPYSGTLTEGDIAVFEQGERLLAHRVTRVEGKRFWAAGDSANDMDGPVDISSLKGTVKEINKAGAWKAVEPVPVKAVRVFRSRIRRVVMTSPLGQLAKKARNVMTGIVPGGLKHAMWVRTFDEPKIVAAAMISSSGLVSTNQWLSLEKALTGKRACLLRAYFLQVRLGDMVLSMQVENKDDRPCAVASCFWSGCTVLTTPVKDALMSHAIHQAKHWGAGCIRIEMDDVMGSDNGREIDL